MGRLLKQNGSHKAKQKRFFSKNMNLETQGTHKNGNLTNIIEDRPNNKVNKAS